MKEIYKQIMKILLVICLIGTPLTTINAQDLYNEADLQLIQEIYDKLHEHHVSNPSREQLMKGAINGLLRSLDDPYTSYLTEDEYNRFINSIDGSYIGIGIYIELTTEGVIVQGIIPDGPAEMSGLQNGDLITHVDGMRLTGDSIEEATMAIIGEEGTEVEIKVVRKGIDIEEVLEFTMTRQKFTLPHIDHSLLDDNVGYLKLHRFGTKSYSLVKEALGDLESQGMESLVLDLRGNPGGLLYSAIEISKLFVESGVVFHARNNTERLMPYSIKDGKNFTKPLVILMDRGSASASEILAGFLQESIGATVIGQQSFGKGTVQRLVDLESGGVLKITVEEYFTPSKKQVNDRGITPDIKVENSELQLSKAHGFLNGKDELWITDEGEILLNGIEDKINHRKLLVKNGKSYISIRLLSEWYNGDIEWNMEAQSIQLDFSGKGVTINKNDPTLYMEAGKSYILLDKLLDKLPFVLEQRENAIVLKMIK
jgi:carboxyl-terminal processing protease